jgi:hypothetical protein
MVSYWSFDEASGTIASDRVDGNEGAISGATWTSGQVGGALSFDGSNDFVRISHSPSINLGTTDFTLEAWVKTSDPDGNIFFHYNSGGYIFGVTEGGKLVGAVRRPGGTGGPEYVKVFSSSTVNDGDWHHVLFIRHYNERIEVYIDGLSDNSNLEGVGDISISVPLDLGRDTVHGRPWFNGLIDEVALHDRALTLEEIQQHYQNGLNGLAYCTPANEPPIAESLAIGAVTASPGDEARVPVDISDATGVAGGT